MPERSRSPLSTDQFYIIDTRTPSNPKGRAGYEYKDLEKNKEYADLIKLQNEGTLSDKFPHLAIRDINRNAANFHAQRMLDDPSTDLAETDEKGLIFIHKQHGVESARKLLRELQILDRDICESDYGLPIMPEEPVRRNRK